MQEQTYVSDEDQWMNYSSILSNRFDLARLPWLRPVIESRWPLFVARCITLLGFVFTILAGLIGTPVGGSNFAIIFVWIAWWTTLKLVFIPLGGRSWCAVCPLPMPGEWLQQGGLISKGSKRLGLGLRWPRKLRGYWLSAALFLVIGLVSAVTLTDARLTAVILLGLVGLDFGLSLIFEKRAFCKYVCPIGGFTGIYAKTAPVEVRVKDTALCTTHIEKTCYQECSWGLYPVALRDSSQCGLCLECLRACPRDNIALNLRPFGEDLRNKPGSARLDEAALALVMLGSALSFAAVFTGPWGRLKMAAFNIGSSEWLAYAAAFLSINLLLLPAAFTLVVWLAQVGKNIKGSFRRIFTRQAQTLLPLGLFSWMAFTISFALPKFSYVVNVVADPFGWGWNLLGWEDFVLTSDLVAIGSVIQVALLVIGLFWSVNLMLSQKDVDTPVVSVWRDYLPGIVFNLSYTLLILWLLVG